MQNQEAALLKARERPSHQPEGSACGFTKNKTQLVNVNRNVENSGGMMELGGESMSEQQRDKSLDRQQTSQECKRTCAQEDSSQPQTQVAVGSQSPSPSVRTESLMRRRAQLSNFNRSLSRASRRSQNWATGTDTARLSAAGSSTRRKGLKEILLQSSEAKPVWLAALLKGEVPDGQQGHDPLVEANLEDLSLVLDPLEHEWMLTVAQGDARSILRLLDQDPSLLSRTDFVTGFTVLHWLAKHGHHEDLIEVITFAEKQRYPVDVNIFTASGRLTPLHLAALQGHEMVIKVLVGAYGANTSLRDHNGRQAWQYLRADAPRELKELLGACEEDVAFQGVFNTNNNCVSSRRSRSNGFKRGCEGVQEEENSRRPIARLTTLRNLFRQAIAFFQER
ncbi:ankyrin repeat domain-containing protein SOWAHD isoform X2 [Heteronotia binoei]|uniref:ankyrin repeat domain-containing protein SOWAHD isoform X2 n=1 Tax=Heteronotia binoei TaxID=13085 RepID=UPI00292E2EF3|nr:ankyrin repeat domain-containing protein SOWAHD isoform X2 [Heteronotia binoei]